MKLPGVDIFLNPANKVDNHPIDNGVNYTKNKVDNEDRLVDNDALKNDPNTICDLYFK